MKSTQTFTRSTHSDERETRFLTHPLVTYDPEAVNGGIEVLKLEYFEAETTKAPVPRNQDVPKDAFGRLTGRSILVATSHAWFHQCHPDPHGVKLEIMRKDFFPRLRKRFPHTEILLFDDWHSCPQWPRRTEEEKARFRKCMEHMNSVYCYCDVVLFVQAPLPDLDERIYECELVPSEHEWLHFIDIIQYVGDEKAVTIRKNDILVGIKGVNSALLTVETMKKMKESRTISFLKRPYGRPNRTPAGERGWLYAERITVAIRMAAAKEDAFDDVVMSNSDGSDDLLTLIFQWSDALRRSARREREEKGSISNQLKRFQDVLSTMKFTFPDDDKLVDEIVTDLVTQFRENWNEETMRQKDISTRTREILLRWGSFSEDYVERAELLCDREGNHGKRRSWVVLGILVGVVAPVLGVVPYLISLEEEGQDPSRDGLIVSSVWIVWWQVFVAVLILHSLNFAFASIPLGIHSFLAVILIASVYAAMSILLRRVFRTIVPFEVVILGCIGLPLSDVLFGMLKFIPVKDERTGQVKKWAIGTWMHMPASHRFDLKARADVKRGLQTTNLAIAFGFAYPFLGGLFFQSGIFIQALLIPVFFIIRAAFEYVADSITSHTYGSDGMPAINFAGVMMHEICLSVMITSIKHPLVFVSLVLSDVLENSFCLWSLAKNVKKTSNRVRPEAIESEEEDERKRKSLTRRSSNVVSLVLNEEDISDKGTALFIAATLLQREAVETLVPMQAAAILSLLYKVDVKSNSIVSSWTDEDWSQSMLYVGVDLGVEMIVFAGTVMVLKRIYPEFDAGRILRGLLRTHSVEMTLLSIAVWNVNLFYQCTYAGIDMTMRFDWLRCKNSNVENSTWLGGFEWEC